MVTKRSKFLSLLLTVAMTVTTVAGMGVFAFADTTATSVTSASQITDMAGNYVLSNNITVTAPIGSATVPFTGTIDGNGKTVTLNINSANGYQAFIANLAGTLEHVIINGSVTSTTTGDYVAAAAAYNSGVINDVRSSATVTASSAYNVGGIAGFNDNYYVSNSVGVIENSINSGNVTGKSKTGGIAGENAGIISSCSNSASVTSTGAKKDGTGGIAGRNGNNNTAVETGIIRDVFNTGNIKDVNAAGSKGRWVGGIVGFQNSLSSTTNCYNTGIISGYDNYGPIYGSNENTTATTTVYASGATAVSSAWDTSSTYPTLKYTANETGSGSGGNTPSGTTVYFDGVGTAAGHYADIIDAINAANGGTVVMSATASITEALTCNENVTVVRASGFTSPMFTINAGSGAYVNMTSMTIKSANTDTAKSGTIFDVVSGTLRLRGSIKLQNAEKAVNVTGGTAEVNKAVISGCNYSIYVANSTGSFVYNDYGDTSIAGIVYLKNGATITANSDLAQGMTIQCESPASGPTVVECASAAIGANWVTNLNYITSGYEFYYEAESGEIELILR